MFFKNSNTRIFFILLVCLVVTLAKKVDDTEKPKWAQKKITDYSDADMERLLDQWNVNSSTHLKIV